MAAFGGLVVVPPANAAVEPMRPKQWYLEKWKIEEAWRISQGEGVTVAIIDSGVDATHPDLRGQIAGEPFGAGDVDRPRGHGTGMASLIAGSGRGLGGQGVIGVAPKAKVVSYNVVAPPDGTDFPYDKAIRQAADSPVKIISVSKTDGWSPESAEAIAYAQSRGKLVVAASGNNDGAPGPNPPYPAAYPGVLGVGGYSNGGKLWSKSTTGYWVSVAGPGEDIATACTGPTRYCIGDGTSAATALTSGVAALLWAAHPDYTANQIIRVLIDSANKPPEGPVPNDSYGWGNVSPRNALNWTGDPGPRDVNPLIGKRGNLPSSSPSPQASSAPATGVPSAQPAPVVPDSIASSDDEGGGSDNVVLVVGALVGGVVVLSGIVAVFIRSRTNRTSTVSRRGPVP